MTLIKCPECDSEKVSDTAKSCLHCGYNIEKFILESKKAEQVEPKVSDGV